MTVRFDRLSTAFKSKISEISCQFSEELAYSPNMIAWGFTHMFAHWENSNNEWATFWTREIPDSIPDDVEILLDADLPDAMRRQCLSKIVPLSPQNPFRVLLVPASTVPSASFQDIGLTLLLPVELSVRAPSAHIPLYRAWKRCLDEFMPILSKRLTIEEASHNDDDTRNLCKKSDILILSGSDETIAHYRRLCHELPEFCRPTRVEHGHRISALALFRRDFPQMTQDAFDAIALDASVWDQSGCLSPKFIFAEISFEQASLLAHQIADSLDLVAHDLKALEPQAHEKAQKNNALLMAQLDGAALVRAHVNGDAILIYPPHTPIRPIAAPRTLQIYCVENAIEAALQLAPRGQAFASLHEISTDTQQHLACGGFNYFCTLGNMQDPPLTWFHDGIGTLAPIVKAMKTRFSAS